MIEYLIIIIFDIYIWISLRILRNTIINNSFKTKELVEVFFYNLITIAVIFFFLKKKIFIFGIIFMYIYLISTLHFRKLILILYYKLYNNIEFLYKRKFIHYNFYLPNNDLCKFFFMFSMIFSPEMFFIYILIFSFFDPNITEQQYDLAIMNKYDEYKIRVFISGKKKIVKYKKFLLDPKKNNKYKFYPRYFVEDKNHLILYWGVDFRFCKYIHNSMFENKGI